MEYKDYEVWNNTLSTLSDSKFFEVVRMYLGDIKTPYNKQEVIRDLNSFLAKKDNIETIIKLLSSWDLKIICAINFIRKPDVNKVSRFFALEKTYVFIYEHLINLQERLIVFTCEDPVSKKKYITINPVLRKALEPYISLNVLCPRADIIDKEKSSFRVNANFISAFISFVLHHRDLNKSDGTLKKKAFTELSKIFESVPLEDADKKKIFETFIKSFRNLNLFHETEKGIEIDWERLESFSKLSEVSQCAYIAAGAAILGSRKTLLSAGELVLKVFNELRYGAYTKSQVYKIFSFIKDRSGGESSSGRSRFEQLLAQNESSEKNESADDFSGEFEAMIDACILLGFFIPQFDTETDEVFYFCGMDISSSFGGMFSRRIPAPGNDEAPKVITLDSAFSVTFMPLLKLSELLPFVKFLDIKRFDTASVYEVSRQSVMRGFDFGLTPELMEDLVKKYSSYNVPQNFSISIEEWYGSYLSAALYKGYVLKVSEENASKIKINPAMTSRIQEELAPGIFIMNFRDDSDARSVISKCGFDFVGQIKSLVPKKEILPFADFYIKDEPLVSKNLRKENILSSSVQIENYLDDMKALLDEMQLTAEQREGLLHRIERKIIINSVQLRANSVRFELLEAGGMDYTGKLHVIDNAVGSKSLLEIQIIGEKEKMIGLPVALNKKTGADIFVIVDEETNTEHTIPVSIVSRVKKLGKSISM